MTIKLLETDPVLKWLDDQNYLAGYVSPAGWVEIFCPWQSEHSSHWDLFAGYKPLESSPHSKSRGFHCFHDSCSRRTTDAFLKFVADSGGPEVAADEPSASLKRLRQALEQSERRGFNDLFSAGSGGFNGR